MVAYVAAVYYVVCGEPGRPVVVHTDGADGTLADVPLFAGGTVREVIVRELRDLPTAGIIRPSRGGGVEILDAGLLTDRAERHR